MSIETTELLYLLVCATFLISNRPTEHRDYQFSDLADFNSLHHTPDFSFNFISIKLSIYKRGIIFRAFKTTRVWL